MFNIATNEVQEKLVALVSAVVVSALFVGAAVGPARAAETAPVQVAAVSTVAAHV